jgi:hypothetical protein
MRAAISGRRAAEDRDRPDAIDGQRTEDLDDDPKRVRQSPSVVERDRPRPFELSILLAMAAP